MTTRNIKYTELVGVVGGLGPKASSMFYDRYIVDARIELFSVMHSAQNSRERFQNVKELSTAAWTAQEVERLWTHTAEESILTDQDHIPILIFGNSQVPGRRTYT